MTRGPPRSPLFPYTTLFRSKSTRLNSSHTIISYAVIWSSDVCSRSEEHTSELQSHDNLVCRLLLEEKKQRGNHSMRALHAPACHVADRARHRSALRRMALSVQCLGAARDPLSFFYFFFFNDTATPEIYPLPLPAPLPI